MRLPFGRRTCDHVEVQVTAALPGGSIQRVLLGACAALLATGLAGAAVVGGGSDTTARSDSASLRAAAGLGATTVPAQPATATQPTAAPSNPTVAGGTAGTAATGPFWGVLLASFPDTPAGADAANVALTAAHAADPQASVVRSDTYSSLRHGYVAVVSSHLASRTAAQAEARRLQTAGFPDANARCVTNGPPCP